MSFIAWQGRSPVDGALAVLVVTGPSSNTKTGPMYQAWLLLRDVSPFEAIKSQADRAICGDCMHRTGERRTCYVSMFNGPIGIWRRLQEGQYRAILPAAAAARLSGEYLRITAYGDPAFVPFETWSLLLSQAAGWAGYTHQWRACDPRFRALLMASVETDSETDEAHAKGWRTFRARPSWMPLRLDEFQCPASDEGGHRSTCVDCQLCRGTSSPAKSVAIYLHGKAAAPKRGQWNKYADVRKEIEAGRVSDLQLTAAQRLRVVLALRHYYLRHKQDVTVRSRNLGNGQYRFWKDAPANTEESC